LTGNWLDHLDNVFVAEDEVEELGNPDELQPPTYQYAFLQLYLQAVAAGILRAVRNDAVALVRAAQAQLQPRASPGASAESPGAAGRGRDRGRRVRGEAIVLSAADVIEQASHSVNDGLPDRGPRNARRSRRPRPRWAIDRFATKPPAACSTPARLGTQAATTSIATGERPDRFDAQPTFAKATAVGDFYVNGKAPPLNGYF